MKPAGGTDLRGFALADADLSSFDRQFHARCRVQRPDRYRLLAALPRDARRIARGSGVSYVAASFGADAISQFVELAVEVFGMLADATRVRIILALRDAGELSVNHLADILDKPPAAVSQHLAKLRLARIVATRQQGQRVFYRLENEHASRLVTDAIFQAEHSLGGVPRHHHAEAAVREAGDEDGRGTGSGRAAG